VLDTLTESAARLCRADRAAIRLSKDGAYHHVASYGFTPEQKEYMKEHALRPDRGSVIGRVVLQGKAVHVVDTKADAEMRLTVGSGFANVRTVLGVQMLREGTPTGVLILTRSTVEPFTDKQIELVTNDLRRPGGDRDRERPVCPAPGGNVKRRVGSFQGYATAVFSAIGTATISFTRFAGSR
jgi:GAF domain